jgi:hypothetical protein
MDGSNDAGSMKNIERFNLYTAYLFATLYEEFPLHTEISPQDVVKAVNLPPPTKLAKNHDAASTEANLIQHTVLWLVDTGYLIERKLGAEGKRIRYVLSPKAFDAMNTMLPGALRQSKEEKTKSVGQKLLELVKDTGLGFLKEGQKQSISQLVSVIIGRAIGS